MNNYQSRHTAMSALSFRGHAGTPHQEAGDFLIQSACVVAAMLAFAVVAAWIGLWAINKPVHPFACDQHRSECAAASEPF